jgi:hypothetical protein
MYYFCKLICCPQAINKGNQNGGCKQICTYIHTYFFPLVSHYVVSYDRFPNTDPDVSSSALFGKKPWLHRRKQKASSFNDDSTLAQSSRKGCCTRVARFFLYMIPKPEKVTKQIQNVPNGYKISQIFQKSSKWQ